MVCGYDYLFKFHSKIQKLIKQKNKSENDYHDLKEELLFCKTLYKLDEARDEIPDGINRLIKKIDDGLFKLSLFYGIKNIDR